MTGDLSTDNFLAHHKRKKTNSFEADAAAKNERLNRYALIGIDPQLPPEDFKVAYLFVLKNTLNKFAGFFQFLIFLAAAIVLLGLWLSVMAGFGAAGIVQLLYAIVQGGIIFWFASICSMLVRIQVAKIENDMDHTVTFRKEQQAMSDEILQAAEKRAGHTINVKNGIANVAFDGSSISDINQKNVVSGDPKAMESLALLLAYCREAGNEEAIQAAVKIANEADKENPDRGLIFECWNTIIKAVPTVLNVVKIVTGIKSML